MPEAGAVAAPRMRRRGFWALGVVVVLLHLLLSNRLLENRLGWGAGEAPPPRIEVAFVRELAAAAPPTLVSVAPAPAERRLAAVAPVAVAPPAAASAPPGPASAPDDDGPGVPAKVSERDGAAMPPQPQPPLVQPSNPVPPVPAPAVLADARPASAPLEPTAAVAQAALAAARAASAGNTAIAANAANAASAVAFEWPPSTRLSFKLRGQYRGPVEGTAQVDWLRSGTRYQVHLETSIGPVLSRHITSEGELTETGLTPRRFDGEQKVIFRAARRWQVRFGPERVVLVDGSEVPTQPGVQDEASQFVQLTWLFTQQPELLKVGGSVDMPLAINRKLETWTYRVVAEQTLRLGFGDLPTFHLKPSREASGGDMAAEIWIAPSLQYLPVRILIRQDAQTWVDLVLEKPPLQAAAAPQTR